MVCNYKMGQKTGILETGTTFTVLCTEGKTPVMKKRLNKSSNCYEISFLEEIIFYKVYYLGQSPY